MSPDEACAVLEVSRRASDAELKAAYRRYVSAHHPDLGGDGLRFAAGVAAYRTLLCDVGDRVGMEAERSRRPRGLERWIERLSQRIQDLVSRSGSRPAPDDNDDVDDHRTDWTGLKAG